MKILIDMNLSPRWVKLFNDAGLELTIGAMNAPDKEIMDYAKNNDYVVLTHDIDFTSILAVTHGEKHSVVQIRAENVSPDVVGRPVIAALRQMAAELEEGALITVDPKRARLRLLPFPAKK